VYSKVHTCNFVAIEGLTLPGNSFPTGVLDTAKGSVVVGSMICFDREHAEPARMLMLNGAEVRAVLCRPLRVMIMMHRL
jgi:predicted amidohydrolase